MQEIALDASTLTVKEHCKVIDSKKVNPLEMLAYTNGGSESSFNKAFNFALDTNEIILKRVLERKEAHETVPLSRLVFKKVIEADKIEIFRHLFMYSLERAEFLSIMFFSLQFSCEFQRLTVLKIISLELAGKL